ncbi:MAG: HvfA family oxazolone/thioamide-modified RiPP metallophore [Gammaproteobacteria bacterium]
MSKRNLKPLAIAAGAALTAGVAAMPVANADENPFGMNALSSGYTVAEKGKGKCGEGKCGEMKDKKKLYGKDKKGEGKCGEGKCGEK